MFDTDETAKTCASWEKFCVTAVNTINKAFTSVSRGCGERCSELCESLGYGHDQVNCDDCCEEDLCNANFSVQYYQGMMNRQYTSWTTPLPGELLWNRKNSYKFPY
uniref:Toxin_TOLIP domain-containing protein n=1 Tax=Heterorhabditis bacteriophora TaxID=37862 RepID=A0A1I7XT67_HETBA